jgi:type I restriction enzyme R subunit
VDAILASEKTKKAYLKHSSGTALLYKAILPDVRAEEFRKTVKAITFVGDAVRQVGVENIDISEIRKDLEELLNQSIEAESFAISERFHYQDLSKLPAEKLKDYFDNSKKRIVVENLKNAIEEKIAEMVRKNKTRLRFMERLDALLLDYNAGSKDVDDIFNELIELANIITEEEQRAAKEGMSDEELAIFDLLKKDGLTSDEEKQVKSVASELLLKIKDKLVLDWRKYEDRRTNVEVAVEDHLFYNLPQKSYDGGLCKVKAHQVYMHIYECYPSNVV